VPAVESLLPPLPSPLPRHPERPAATPIRNAAWGGQGRSWEALRTWTTWWTRPAGARPAPGTTPAPSPAAAAAAQAATLQAATLLATALAVGGCVTGETHSSGLILPLPRRSPGDGLAVVNGPQGQGIHIWLDPDTSVAGICQPRWNPDPARLRRRPDGTLTSGGRAPRQEFYEALRRGPVRLALRRQLAILCRQRAPASRFLWREPPRSDAAFLPVLQPLWEEEHLLSNPTAVRRSEKQLLGLPLNPDDWDDRRPPRPPNGP
jgi:hypothetical protein